MSAPEYPIILASKSPRRRELFSLITDTFTCAVSDVDESAVRETGARTLCKRLAELKARAVFAAHPGSVVVGCDTVVEIDGSILGKPRDTAEARRMLQTLSGQTHTVYTGVCVCGPRGDGSFVCQTTVAFFPVSPGDIEAYIATEEPYDKAGAYGIQGMAAKFVRGIRGDYFNVMGLPVSRLYNFLNKLRYIVI